MNGCGNRRQPPPGAENRWEGARVSRLRRRVTATVVTVGLMAGAGSAEQSSRAIPEHISRAVPERVAIDALYQTSHCTILHGHAEDFGGIADLLDNLWRSPVTEEPVLREITRSERGYEYSLEIPKAEPRPQGGPLRRTEPSKPEPFFASRPVARVLGRLLVPPFT